MFFYEKCPGFHEIVPVGVDKLWSRVFLFE